MASPSANRSYVRPAGLEFLWIELTNRCNLECVHCYADSSPWAIDVNPLTPSRRLDLLQDARAAGCSVVQFIGGEPTLDPSLASLVEAACRLGFKRIEVYTNLVSLKEDLLRTFARCGVSIATSVYADSAEPHDAVTTRPGSWERTLANLQRCLNAGLAGCGNSLRGAGAI